MTTVTDDEMRARIAKTKDYSVIILKAGPNKNQPGADKIIWEHGRRNFTLRSDGLMPIVLPIADGSDVSGIAVFNVDAAQTKAIMDQDPAVKAGIFVYELHTCRGFPGDCLPK